MSFLSLRGSACLAAVVAAGGGGLRAQNSRLVNLSTRGQVRASAADAIQDLRGLGIEHMLLLTGDRAAVAHHVADQVGI